MKWGVALVRLGYVLAAIVWGSAAVLKAVDAPRSAIVWVAAFGLEFGHAMTFVWMSVLMDIGIVMVACVLAAKVGAYSGQGRLRLVWVSVGASAGCYAGVTGGLLQWPDCGCFGAITVSWSLRMVLGCAMVMLGVLDIVSRRGTGADDP